MLKIDQNETNQGKKQLKKKIINITNYYYIIVSLTL